MAKRGKKPELFNLESPGVKYIMSTDDGKLKNDFLELVGTTDNFNNASFRIYFDSSGDPGGIAFFADNNGDEITSMEFKNRDQMDAVNAVYDFERGMKGINGPGFISYEGLEKFFENCSKHYRKVT